MLKATGMVRRIDSLGRIVIPKEIRRKLGFDTSESFEIFVNDQEQVVLSKSSGRRKEKQATAQTEQQLALF